MCVELWRFSDCSNIYSASCKNKCMYACASLAWKCENSKSYVTIFRIWRLTYTIKLESEREAECERGKTQQQIYRARKTRKTQTQTRKNNSNCTKTSLNFSIANRDVFLIFLSFGRRRRGGKRSKSFLMNMYKSESWERSILKMI